MKCYECGRVFRINVQKYGVSKYRCPDCGNVVPFLLTDQGPVVQAMPMKRPSFWRRLWSAFMWLFHLIVRFLKWCNRKIRTFREKYEDADLWLFFGFSFLFVVGVIVGLWLMAQITILFSDVHSWFFQMFLKLKFML